MATIIRAKDLKTDSKYEPPFGIAFGINNKTVEDPKMVIGYTVEPPGAHEQRHYHANCDAVNYGIKGCRRLFIGPDHEMQEFIVGPGDFVFVPKGEIHGAMNLSESDTAELVFCYTGVSSKEEARTIFVEPPWK